MNTRLNLLRGATISVIMLIFAVVSAKAATFYTITDLGNLGATTGGPFFPRYLNDNNQVVGVSPTGSPGVYSAYSSLNGAPMTNIGGLGGNSVGFAVNNSGVIVGQSENAGITTATRWDAGVPSAVSGLAGPNNSAGGINNSGQIAGWMDAVGGAVAYRLTGTTLENFGNLGSKVTDINGMNAAGRFVGNSETPPGGFTSFRAFVSSDTSASLINLGTLSGDNTSLAFGINNANKVIGTSNFFQPSPFVFTSRGFIWDNGVMTEIPRPLGYEMLSPSGINNFDTVVGRITTNVFSTTSEAFIYESGALSLLTSKLDAGFSGWQITNAWEINDAGFIAAEAIDPGGFTRNVLLTPIPEPGTWALILFTLPAAWLVRRRRLVVAS